MYLRWELNPWFDDEFHEIDYRFECSVEYIMILSELHIIYVMFQYSRQLTV